MKKMRKAILALILVFSFAVPLPVGAAMNGIDVSSWQSGIQVDQVQGVEFVIAKATEGTSYVNPDCDRVYWDAKTAGKRRAYITTPAEGTQLQRQSILSIISAGT